MTERSFKITQLCDYFFAKKSFTFSLVTIASLKAYAPVFSDLTILITLVKFFTPDCNDATVFLAITLNYFIS